MTVIILINWLNGQGPKKTQEETVATTDINIQDLPDKSAGKFDGNKDVRQDGAVLKVPTYERNRSHPSFGPEPRTFNLLLLSTGL